MAVLIVDCDPHAREAVRKFLKEMGVPVVLGAKNREEAERILSQPASRLRFILSECAVPGLEGNDFLDLVSRKPELNGTPFLMMTSDDFGRKRLGDFRRHRRLDGILLKPFGASALARAMSSAFSHRRRQNDILVYLGRDSKLVTFLENEVRAQADPQWKQVVAVNDYTLLNSLLPSDLQRIGAILLDPTTSPYWGKDWTGNFKKTLQGSHTLLVALSRDPALIRPLRNQCQFFLDQDRLREELAELLPRLSARIHSEWDRECVGNRFKAAYREKSFAEAAHSVKRLLRLDRHNAEVLCFAADLFARRGKNDRAARYYRQALASNPCFPHPYIKLMELLPKHKIPEDLLKSASQYCPDHPGVQRFVKQFGQGSGKLPPEDDAHPGI